MQRHGHLLQFNFSRPTKRLDLRLDYAHAGIRWMNTADYIAGSQASRVEQAQSFKDAKVVNISFDGWVLPRAGVAFVWVLDEELGSAGAMTKSPGWLRRKIMQQRDSPERWSVQV